MAYLACFGQQPRVVQLRLAVAAIVGAAGDQHDLRLILLEDRARLFRRELAVIGADQLGAGGQRSQLGGKATLLLAQRHGDHLEATLGAGAGQAHGELDPWPACSGLQS